MDHLRSHVELWMAFVVEVRSIFHIQTYKTKIEAANQIWY